MIWTLTRQPNINSAETQTLVIFSHSFVSISVPLIWYTCVLSKCTYVQSKHLHWTKLKIYQEWWENWMGLENQTIAKKWKTKFKKFAILSSALWAIQGRTLGTKASLIRYISNIFLSIFMEKKTPTISFWQLLPLLKNLCLADNLWSFLICH